MILPKNMIASLCDTPTPKDDVILLIMVIDDISNLSLNSLLDIFGGFCLDPLSCDPVLSPIVRVAAGVSGGGYQPPGLCLGQN